MGIAVQPVIPSFVALLALSACFVDPGTATGASGMTTMGSTTAVDAASTGVMSGTEPALTSSSSSSSSSSSASDPVGSDGTTGAACVAGGGDCTGPGASCCGCLSCEDGTCAAGPGACAACQSCDGQGACVPAGEGTMCSPAADPCSGRVWGAVNGECFAFAAAQGSCGPQGDCIPQACEAKGELVFSCPQCVLSKHGCLPGVALGSFDVGDFCHLNAETTNCGIECVDNGVGSEVKHKSCNSKGKCTTIESMNCGLYACDGDQQCHTSCMTAAQCVLSKCIEGKCG